MASSEHQPRFYGVTFLILGPDRLLEESDPPAAVEPVGKSVLRIIVRLFEYERKAQRWCNFV